MFSCTPTPPPHTFFYSHASTLAHFLVDSRPSFRGQLKVFILFHVEQKEKRFADVFCSSTSWNVKGEGEMTGGKGFTFYCINLQPVSICLSVFFAVYLRSIKFLCTIHDCPLFLISIEMLAPESADSWWQNKETRCPPATSWKQNP